MKRGTIIGIAFTTYVIAMIGMFLGVDKYIQEKDDRLSREIHTKINSIFTRQEQYVDIAYSGYPVEFEKVEIPIKPIFDNDDDPQFRSLDPNFEKRMLKEWNQNYGDLSRLFRIHYKRSDWDGPLDYEDGWNLVILESTTSGVSKRCIFPYAVGYIKQEYYWGESYMPSIKNAVYDAFKFFTTNNQSYFYNTFEKGCFDNIWKELYSANNDYYYLEEDEYPRSWIGGDYLFEKPFGDVESSPRQNGYMHNGLYRVFIASTQPRTYSIQKYSWNPDEVEKKELWKYWSIGLTVLLLLIVIPLWIIDSKHQKIKEEGLYDKLKRLCNPTNFLKDYDKEKVDKANLIYQKLLSINENDTEALQDLQKQAVSDLGICLIDPEKLADLKEKVNPKNFMTPYNAEKVTLSNELYSILCKEDLTYTELVEVEERAKLL